ncbi:predicted protein [Naegleria gruberi]|uniref:Predicted protein n=1 Tax=Naegleria gruberi TaxID=5762 RepID=D2VQB0_NAEGR|nr:uncharacterized protein NAEGRDRAFT_71089 [Naegleria gruberi]EFC41079.1 predicted protein [Naegleria gruberi]|eukprot:XP_002673823.1 predicted protein [Naegleria gruberi strain NEG-M]
MYQLPPEIMCLIFGYFAEPYSFVRDLIVWRQINRTTYEMLDNASTFSLLLDLCSIRDPANLKKDYHQRKSKTQRVASSAGDLMVVDREPTQENKNNMEDNSDDDSESDNESENCQFYKSHTFIDGLLQHSLRNQFIGYKKNNNWNYMVRGLLVARSELDLFDDGPQLHDLVEEWIEAYSIDNRSCILQLLLEISLGKEMIEHLGMRNIGYSIVVFFHKLFEPAIQTVTNWRDQPKPELEFSDIFNRNLYEFLEMNMKKETFLKDEMSVFWFEMETMNNSIPRQIILFIAENFSHLNIKLSNGEEKVCSIYIFEELRKFGICVEKLKFIDRRSKMCNFERTTSLNRIIPLSSNGFYLQHFAVWINSIPLLEYCLSVDSTLTKQTLLDYFDNQNVNISNISLNSYSKSYISDHSMFSVLHYAVLMSNVEMVDILINKYMANPFHKHFSRKSSLYLAIQNTFNILRGRKNEEDAILKIITDRYGLKCLENENFEANQVLYNTDSYHQEGDEIDYSYDSEFDPVPLNEHCVVEMVDYCPETNIDDYSSDEEYEEGLSYSSLIGRYKEIEQDHNVLKRKRFDPLVFDEDMHNFSQIDVKDCVRYFESDDWDTELALQEIPCEDSFISLLSRNGVKKAKLNNQEMHTINMREEHFDEAMVTSRAESCTIPKKLFNNLIYQVSQDYRSSSIWLPNARMLLQQACENFVNETFKTANAHSQLCNYQHSTLIDHDMLNTFQSNKTLMDKFGIMFGPFNSCHSQFNALLRDDSYDCYIQNIENLSKDVFICIDLFETFTTNSGADDEDDDYIDNMSSCSSDSMVSTVCKITKDFDGIGNDCYSTISLSEYQEFNPNLIREDSLSNKYIQEANKNFGEKVQFYSDRDDAIDAVNRF